MAFFTSKSRSVPQHPAALGDFEVHVQRVREQRERERAAALAEVFPGLIMAPPPPPSTVKVVGLSSSYTNKSASTVPHLAPSQHLPSTNEKFQFGDETSLSSSSEEDDDFPRLASPRQQRNKAKAPKTPGEKEPTTLAKLLFRFGFLMPVFWVLGALILILPLKHYSPSQTGSVSLPIEDPLKPEEIEAHLALIRRVELKWAWRSVYALVIVTMTVLFAVLIYLGLTGRWNGF